MKLSFPREFEVFLRGVFVRGTYQSSHLRAHLVFGFLKTLVSELRAGFLNLRQMPHVGIEECMLR